MLQVLKYIKVGICNAHNSFVLKKKTAQPFFLKYEFINRCNVLIIIEFCAFLNVANRCKIAKFTCFCS